MNDYTFITSNTNKAKEIERILGVKLKAQNLDIVEIQSLDFKEVVRAKVLSAYDKIKQPVIVEDSGVVINTWGKLPGPFWRYFENEDQNIYGCDLVCKMLNQFKDKSAIAVCIIALTKDGNNVEYFLGETKGSIVCPPKGENGFGFDFMFVPSGINKTFAQMSGGEKDQFSPRGKVLDKLKDYLTN